MKAPNRPGWHCTMCGRRAWKAGYVGAPFIHYGWGPLCHGTELVWKDERDGEPSAGAGPGRTGIAIDPIDQSSRTTPVSLVPPGAQAKLGLGATCAPPLPR